MDNPYKQTRYWLCSLLMLLLFSALMPHSGYASTIKNKMTASKPAKIASKSVKTVNLWTVLADSTQLSGHNRQAPVQEQIDWFNHHQKFLSNIITQASPYLFYIYQEVERRQLPVELVLLPLIESAYDPFAHSWVGAAGLWQFMPQTASSVGIKQNWWYDGRRDVITSTQAALDYLISLHKTFNGDWLLAVAAYNAGAGTVQKAIARNRAEGKSVEFWALPLPKETKTYVPRLIALSHIINHRSQYHLQIPSVHAKPYFAEVDIGQQIDLAHAAKMADITVNELYQLNPGYSRWTTDPDGPHKLLLPVKKVDTFASNMAEQSHIQVKVKNYPSLKPHRTQLAKYTSKNNTIASTSVKKQANHSSKSKTARSLTDTSVYKVHNGDTLNLIAQHFATTPALIQQANALANNIIRPGQVLYIPRSRTA